VFEAIVTALAQTLAATYRANWQRAPSTGPAPPRESVFRWMRGPSTTKTSTVIDAKPDATALPVDSRPVWPGIIRELRAKHRLNF
jgi:uncharacterized protein (DUF2267 family)